MSKEREFYAKAFYNNLPIYLEIINKKLSEQYELQPLNGHIKVVGGYAFKSNEYLDEGVPIIRISDFNNERIDLSNVKKYKETDDLKRYELYPGDIIIAMTGGTIGKLAIVQKGLGKLYLNQRVGKLEVLNKELFHPEYIYWIAKGVQGEVNRIGYGGAQPNISNRQIEALNFPFPKKTTQESIVSFLNDLKNNDLCKSGYFDEDVEGEINRLQFITIDCLKFSKGINGQCLLVTQLRKSILQQAVEGKLVLQDSDEEPASVLLKKIRTEKELLIREKKIKKEKPLPKITEDDIPYELPQGWEWVRLGDVCTVITDGTHYTPDYVSEGIPFLSVKDISKGIINFSNTKFISIEEHEVLTKRCKPEFEDVLLTKIGTTGIAKVIDTNREFSIFVSVALLKIFKHATNPYFLVHLLNSPLVKKQSADGTEGVGNKNLVLRKIQNFIVPIPPFNEQIRILEKVDQLMALCDELEGKVGQSKQDSEKLMEVVLLESFQSA